MVKQLCHCSPWRSTGNTKSSHHSPWGRCPCWSGWMPGGSCDPIGDPVDRGGPCFQAGAACPCRTAAHGKRDPHHSSFGRTMCPWGQLTLQQVWFGCCSSEWTRAREVHGELTPVGGTPRSHRGRTALPEQWKKISVMN